VTVTAERLVKGELVVLGSGSSPRASLTVIRIDSARGIAVVEAFRRPLVLWVWLGGLLVAAGGGLALRRPGSRRPTPLTPESSNDTTTELILQ
jgi:hypothetical protein